MDQYKQYLTYFLNAFTRLKSFYEETYKEILDQTATLRTYLLVLKDYSENYLFTRENDFKLGFIEESDNYKTTLSELVIMFEEFNERIFDLNHYAELLKNVDLDIDCDIYDDTNQLFNDYRFKFDQNINKFKTYIIRTQSHTIDRVTNLLTGPGDVSRNKNNINQAFNKLSGSISEALNLLREGEDILEKLGQDATACEQKIKSNIPMDSEEDIQKAKNLADIAEEDKEVDEVISKVKNLSDLDDDLDKLEESLKHDTVSFGLQEILSSEANAGNNKKGVIYDGGALRDGEIKLDITRKGIFASIEPAYNGGLPIREKDVESFLFARKLSSITKEKISELVENTGKGFFKLAEWSPNHEYDARALVKIEDKGLFAYIFIEPPMYYGRMVDMQDIKEVLKEEGIVFGIKKDALNNLVTREAVNTYILIAEGIPPEPGDDGKFEYFFNTDIEEINLEQDEKGRVDYKSLNLIQNVVADQILAKKSPPTLGKPGKDVFDKEIPAIPGKEAQITLGNNTAFTNDGISIIATDNGHVNLKNNKISVEHVYVVNGDVDYKIGNITFIGSVLVNGNVLDGFKIDASGDVEIKGTVGKCNITSESNIVVQQGILGKDEGVIKAGGDVIAKFIENAYVYAGNDIIVQREILNSRVIATRKVHCKGKKANIVGGRVYAGEEIVARFLGSDYFVPTLVEVGIPPEIKEKYRSLQEEQILLKQEFDKILKAFKVLRDIEKKQGSLTDDKKKIKDRVTKSKIKNINRSKEIEEELEEVKTAIDNFNITGSIIVIDTAYPEVSVNIRNANYKIEKAMTKIQFVQIKGEIIFKAIGKVNKINKSPSTKEIIKAE